MYSVHYISVFSFDLFQLYPLKFDDYYMKLLNFVCNILYKFIMWATLRKYVTSTK